MSACRCSQLSGCRSRLCRCRNRSSPPVTASQADPGRNRPTAALARSNWATARCDSVASGCDVTFCRGISVTALCSTPRKAKISSSVLAGSSTSWRYRMTSTWSRGNSENTCSSCSPYRLSPV